MKKILLPMLALSFALMSLASCGSPSPQESNQLPNAVSEALNNALSTTEASKPTEPASKPVLPSLTPSKPSLPALVPTPTPAPSASADSAVDKAVSLYNAWLATHDELSSYTLNSQDYQTFDIFGEPYYWFGTEDPTKYWYHVLIPVETGELLFMMKSDGEYTSTTIEPLEDWYNNVFVDSSESTDTPSAPAFLTIEEAIAVYDSWLSEHAEVSSYTLNRQYHQTFDLFGEPYYWFSTDNPTTYWYQVLVPMEAGTGELLFMMISDGEHSATSIERLEDWYGNTYNFG